MNGAIGLVVGTLLGIVSYRVLRAAADKAARPEAASLLRKVALAELCCLPIIGVLVGAFVIGN